MLACENAIMDMQNNLSVTNIVDRLTSPQFPTMTPSFFIVFGLQNVLPAVYTTKITIEHGDGTVIFDQTLPDTAVTSQQKKARIIANVRGLAWPKTGEYFVKLFLKNNLAGGFTIELAEAQASGITFYQPPPPQNPQG